MRDTTGGLQIQLRKVTYFRYDILCVLTHVTRKLLVVYGHLTCWMTALLLEMSIICVRAHCEIWLASYGSQHASQSLFDIAFMCVYTHNSSAYPRIVWFRESCMKDLTGELWVPDMQPYSDTKLCAHILEACTYIAIWCATTHDNKTHVPYDCLLYTKRCLYCQRHIVL